jgi:hypothetical protein
MARCAMAQINLARRRFMQLVAGAAASPASFVPSSVPAQPSPPTETARTDAIGTGRDVEPRPRVHAEIRHAGAHGGFCWAASRNSRSLNAPLDRDLDNLIWDMVRQFRSWHA